MPRKKKEANTEAKGNALAKKRGMLHRKMNGLGFNSWPDRMYLAPPACKTCKAGRVVFVEYKREGKDATKLQAELHDQLRALGHTVHVIDNVEDTLSVLSSI